MDTRTGERGWASRGQSEVVGVILLLGIVVVGATATVALGSDVLDSTRGVVTTSGAEHAMTQLDSKASLVAHGDSDGQGASLSGARDAERRVDADAGWMNVTVYDEDGNVDAVLMNVTLGAVVYEDGATDIAYQGGGVWRRTDDGSSMVSPPEFHYRGTTVTLPLVVVDGDQRLSERVRVSRGGPTREVYPNTSASPSLLNPLTSGKVVVTVGSDYYEAWGRFFTERTGGQATVDHENGTASIELVTPTSTEPVSTALSSSSPGDDLELSGNGENAAFVDSYNSSEGDYANSRSNNGTVLTAGNVKMSGNSQINGTVRAGGEVGMKGSSTVTGAVEWTVDFINNSNSISYDSQTQISGVETAESVDRFTRSRIDAIADDNDNDGTSAIDNGRLNFTDGTATLSGSKDYYLDEIDMDSGRKLVVDTGDGGETEIAIGDDLQMAGANITVEGNGTVRLYVGDDVSIQGASSVYVPDDRSQGLWLYGTDDTDVDLSGNNNDPARFVGILYTPSTDNGGVSLERADVYGGVVGGELSISTGGSVHYDASLATRNPIPQNADVAHVTYLHVSVVEVEVEDA